MPIDLDFIRIKLPGFLTNPDPEVYSHGKYVVLDFETTIRNGSPLALYNENSIVMVCWHDVDGVEKVIWGGEYDMGPLLEDIKKADFIVAHNAKFELQWLHRCGLDLSKVIVWCTQIGEYVIGGNRWRFQALGLDRSAQRRLGQGKITVVSKMFKAGLSSEEIPAEWLERYCRQDVRLARDLFLAQRDYMQEDGWLLPVMYTRCLATPVFADLELNGMYLDHATVGQRHDELERAYGAIQARLEEITGGINVNSPLQVREYLYETLGFAELTDYRGKVLKTDTGLARTDADTISRLKAETPEQREFVEAYKEMRGLYNELTKYLRKFHDCCTENGGHLVAEFNQTNTQTHRTSSSGLDYRVQFQNFPGAYKTMFVPRHEGWKIGESDSSQLEFRIAAHLGRCQTALADIRNPEFDAHVFSSSTIKDIDYDELLAAHRSGDKAAKAIRQGGKPHTFKPLYGGTSGTKDEKRYYSAFRDRYTGITAAQEDWINEVLENKKLRTEWGLVYYWPNTRRDRSGYITNTTSICNYPVQAFATAEIIPIALVYMWHYIRASGLQMFLTNTIHDSVIGEFPPEEEETWHALSARCLIDEIYFYLQEVYEIHLTVPLGCEVSSGPTWGVGEETKYNAPEELYESVA